MIFTADSTFFLLHAYAAICEDFWLPENNRPKVFAYTYKYIHISNKTFSEWITLYSSTIMVLEIENSGITIGIPCKSFLCYWKLLYMALCISQEIECKCLIFFFCVLIDGCHATYDEVACSSFGNIFNTVRTVVIE